MCIPVQGLILEKQRNRYIQLNLRNWRESRKVEHSFQGEYLSEGIQPTKNFFILSIYRQDAGAIKPFMLQFDALRTSTMS